MKLFLLQAVFAATAVCAEVQRSDVLAKMEKATRYMQSLSTEGGYVNLYSAANPSKRAGEWFLTSPSQIWIQTPGTPAMGMAFLKAWEATGDSLYLEAARRAAAALAKSISPIGGWYNYADLSPERPAALIHDESGNPAAISYDDNITQGATQFLMRYVEASGDSANKEDAEIRGALRKAMEGFLSAQYPNGAWPQRYYGEVRKEKEHSLKAASYPSKIPKKRAEGESIRHHYTLNDHALRDCILVMLEAWRRYGKQEYLESARRGADFLISARLPEPQPGWAEQYNFDMQPAWGRRFEPPSVGSVSTASAMAALLEVYLETGEDKYLEAIAPAMDWLQRSALKPGLWARLYELHTNRPIYGTNDWRIAYDLSEAKPGYRWQIDSSGVPQAIALYNDVKSRGREAVLASRAAAPDRSTGMDKLTSEASQILDRLDGQGRWLTEESLQAGASPEKVVSTAVYIRNMTKLAEYLERTENPSVAVKPN